MKKIFILLIMILVLTYADNLSLYAIEQEKESPNEFVSKYEVNSPEWTDEEYEKYYVENEIFPMATFGEAMDDAALKQYLKDEHSSINSSTWQVKTDTIANVMSVYHGNKSYNPSVSRPRNVTKNNSDIQTALSEYIIDNELSSSYSPGCGPLAMIGQFDFLARYAGYYPIMPEPDSLEGKIQLARDVLNNTTVLSSETMFGDLHDYLSFVGSGSFTWPNEVISSSNELLESYGLSVSATRIVDGQEETYYTDESQIVVSGDEIPSFLSINEKVNNLKSSIDDGMPVIVWTSGFNAEFEGHYFNVFGYEYWDDTSTSVDENYLVFKANYNWNENGDPKIYVPYEYFDEWNCGFIYFEENHDKALVYASDIPSQDSFSVSSSSFPVESSVGGYNFTSNVKRLLHLLDSEYFYLSANKPSAGESYIEYTSPKVIDKVYFCANWVSLDEKDKTSIAKVQYKNSLGIWTDAYDILNHQFETADHTKSFGIWCDFPTYTYSVRIYLYSTETTSDGNSYGLRLYNVYFLFGEHTSHSYTYQYTQYSDTYHYGYCECGMSSLRTHVFITSGTKQRCKLCNYVLDSDYGIIGPMGNRILHSANGSYVLANGVVFLVDEDIDAYFNGTLVFFNSNNQIVLQ